MVATVEAELFQNVALVATSGAVIAPVDAGQGLAFGGLGVLWLGRVAGGMCLALLF